MSPPFYSTTVPLILGFNRILSYLLDLIHFLLFHFLENSLDVLTLLYNSSAQTLLMHSSLTSAQTLLTHSSLTTSLTNWSLDPENLHNVLLQDLCCLVSWYSLLNLQLPTCYIIQYPFHRTCHSPHLKCLPIFSGYLNTICFFKVQVPPFSWSLLMIHPFRKKLFSFCAPALLSLTFLYYIYYWPYPPEYMFHPLNYI